MNHESLKKQNIIQKDESSRLREASRIEADYHLDLALRHLYMANHGRFPTQEVAARLNQSLQYLASDFASK